MKTTRRHLKAMREKIRQGPDRSPLFVWMVDHHADLLARNRSGRMPWVDLCADFAELGLRDGKGNLPTPKRAGETWRFARAEVAALAKQRESEKGLAPPSHRSRQRQEWEPPLARTEKPAGRRAPPPPPPKAPATGAYDHLPEEVRAQLTAVDEQFAYLDRNIIRPKQRT